MKTSSLVLGGLLVAGCSLLGCAQTSEAPFKFDSAPTPEGWPEPTPVDAVAIVKYPAYRQAIVTEAAMPGADTGPMFGRLFDHIQKRDIAMTAPVDMGYASAEPGTPRRTSMAFLYRVPADGPVGADGVVSVQDVAPSTWASVGVRGGYTDDNFASGLALLRDWLAARADTWQVVGPPRYLGYNSPFVLPFMRYGEVQLPVVPVDQASAGTR